LLPSSLTDWSWRWWHIVKLVTSAVGQLWRWCELYCGVDRGFCFYVVVCFVWILHFAVQEKKNVAHWISNIVGATVTISVAVCSSGISPEHRWAGTKAVFIFRVQLLLYFCYICLALLCKKKFKHSCIRISL